MHDFILMCEALPTTLWGPWAPWGVWGSGASHFTSLLENVGPRCQERRSEVEKMLASRVEPYLLILEYGKEGEDQPQKGRRICCSLVGLLSGSIFATLLKHNPKRSQVCCFKWPWVSPKVQIKAKNCRVVRNRGFENLFGF